MSHMYDSEINEKIFHSAMNPAKFDSAITHHTDQYFAETGTAYVDSMFPTPSSVPSNIMKTVKAIKLLRLEKKQIEIIVKVRSSMMERENYSILDSNTLLYEEFEKIKRDINQWNEI